MLNLEKVNYYHINSEFVLMTSEYDSYGKHCSIVMAGNTTFLVEKSPEQILSGTSTYIGLDLEGSRKGAKSILGEKKRIYPIIINPYQDICLLSDKSMKCFDSIIFNLDQIENVVPVGKKTKVILKNGMTIIVDSHITSFNNKMMDAQKLKKLTGNRGRQSMMIRLDPPANKEITRNKKGKYSFEG